MPVAITVRHVPESVRDRLAARAASSGRSLQEYLLHHLTDVACQPTLDEVVGEARARARALGTVLDPEALVADRNADRR